VSRTFAPELRNRLDRVVVFRPFTRDVMRKILQKEIADASARRGLRRREWAVEIEEGALDFLLDRGFTTDLGARPLKRSLERHLLAPLARTIVERRVPEGDQFLFVRTDGDALAVEFVDPDAPPSIATVMPAAAARPGADLRAIAWDAHGTAAEMSELRASLERFGARIDGAEWAEMKKHPEFGARMLERAVEKGAHALVEWMAQSEEADQLTELRPQRVQVRRELERAPKLFEGRSEFAAHGERSRPLS